jgi:hypothetical protein
MPGEPTELYIRARRALLDALDALGAHRDSVVLVGAQAIYMHTGEIDEAIATETKDSDLVVDPEDLGSDPLIEEALERAGFHPDLERPQPGTWFSPDGIPVDLLVPAAVAPGNPKRRGVDLPPHARRSFRRVDGLEAALVDQDRRLIEALEPDDHRRYEIALAGPAALLVAKLQKLTDRQEDKDERQVAKDGHDVYRLFRDVPLEEFVRRLTDLLDHDLTRERVYLAREQLRILFGRPDSPGARMAGETVAGVGDPGAVAEAASILANELLTAMDDLLGPASN